MIYGVIALLLIGVALVIAEASIPGFGICGITGALLLIISAVCTIVFIPFGIYIVVAEVCLIALALYAAIKLIKRKQLYGKLVLSDTLEFDESPLGDLRFFIGKEGVSKTPLKPVGHVDFNGTVLEVMSDGAYIAVDKKVKVIDANNKKVIVRQVQ